ncbi:MAG: hypothetical protein Kow001_21670 [Acidobacteriota bacterium]
MRRSVSSVLLAGFWLCASDSAAKAIGETEPTLWEMEPGRVHLLPGPFERSTELNRRYLMSLGSDQLLQNFYLEAGLWNPIFGPDSEEESRKTHWGWESPTCQLRGHFLGHWLSAAARRSAAYGDQELKAKADRIVAELARCQAANGGEWAASIPEKYFHWIAGGRRVWAPHYTVHKTFMGLIDMYRLAGNPQALEVADRFARWFHRWTAGFSRGQMDDILDVETGGMLEAWADLYGLTRSAQYLELMQRYDRPRLFDRLLAGEDPLTNRHANTTIPEAQGAARAWELTRDQRWRRIVDAYWKSAVDARGYYCTGGQTDGEIWGPPHDLSARLSDQTQEHCTVYNMIRLADYLLRWTGDVAYADYIERNLYNGILAQQNRTTGMVTYFLPLQPGARKRWSHPTRDFWCCVGTLVQAHTLHDRYTWYRSGDGLVVAQYIASQLDWSRDGVAVRASLRLDPQTQGYGSLLKDDPVHRPTSWVVEIAVNAEREVPFELRLRVPWWVDGGASLRVNGEDSAESYPPSSWIRIRRSWKDDRLQLVLPKRVRAVSLPGSPDLAAFMDGPVVLAGLSEEERELRYWGDDPASILVPDGEREWATWLPGYRAKGQERGLRFRPLFEITDETYTVYFFLRKE